MKRAMLALQQDSSAHRFWSQTRRISRYGTKMRPAEPNCPLRLGGRSRDQPAKPGRVLDEGVENRLHVKRRAADDFQNFAGRRLMIQGFGQVRVAFLQFFEQPHVLDGDDGLVGEGFEQSICFSENGRTSVRRIRDHADRTPFSLATGSTRTVRIPSRSMADLSIGNSAASEPSRSSNVDQFCARRSPGLQPNLG